MLSQDFVWRGPFKANLIMNILRTHKKQKGTATIELALVFGLLFGLLWGVISYTFPLILLQTMNRAVAESMRVVATVPTTTADYQTAVRNIAVQELSAQMQWLPSSWTAALNLTKTDNIQFLTNAACTSSRPSCLVAITLTYQNYKQQPIVPSITLPFIGEVPRLPNNLESSAQAVF